MNAVSFTTRILLVIVALGVVFVNPLLTKIASGAAQSCITGTSCTVGEFLYDDSYVPISTATCTLTSRDPSGTLYLDGVAMTAASDGWYSYQFTAPATTGHYRSQVCCTAGTDYLCLDKSFTVDSPQLSESDVTSAVWDANRSSYVTAGTFGASLQNLVPAAEDIASATWSFSGRTLSTYGTLITDIWSSPTRSLTTFGTLVADIWNNATRTLTGATLDSGSLATVSEINEVKSSISNVQTDVDSLQTDIDTIQTDVVTIKGDVDTIEDTSSDVDSIKSDVASIKSEVSSVKSTASSTSTSVSSLITKTDSLTNTVGGIKSQNDEIRDLLEPLVNKPIIENLLEEQPDLISKIDQSKTITAHLVLQTQYLKSKIALLKNRPSKTPEETLKNINELIKIIGEEKDALAQNSIFGELNWLKEAWEWPIMGKSLSQAQTAKTSLQATRRQLEISGETSSVTRSLQNLNLIASGIEKMIGSPNSQASSKTIFGQIQQTKELTGLLDKQATKAKDLLGNWQGDVDRPVKINQLSKEVAKVNQFTKINPLLLTQITKSASERNQKNKVLSLKGVIEANRQLLASKPNKPFASTWLEEGSVVFKTLVTNPSKRISQKVAIKYHLPTEVKKEDILETEEGLTIAFDAEKNAFYVSGEITLGVGESRTLSVRVEDIWRYSEEEVESLRKQAEELSKPLNGTSYFAQGVTLKTDIDSSLDKVLGLQRDATTPERKIKAYREAQIEMRAAQAKIDKLKDLVSSAASVGTMFGFVGGTQVLAVWGLIIIMAAGFVFLVLYMRVLRPTALRPEGTVPVEKPKHLALKKVVEEEPIKKKPFLRRKMGLLAILLIFGVCTSLLTTVVINRTAKKELSQVYDKPVTKSIEAPSENVEENSASVEKDQPEENKTTINKEGANEQAKEEKSVKLFVPTGSLVTMHKQQSLTSSIVATFQTSKLVQVLEKSDGWAKVLVLENAQKQDSDPKNSIQGWVNEAFLEEESSGVVGQRFVEVKDTPTGFLRVREIPQGTEIGRVKPFDIFPLIEEEDGWVRIQLGDGTLGWVSRQYALVKKRISNLSFVGTSY